MSDLSTSYLGLALRNPLVASASPLSEGVDRVRALADSGAVSYTHLTLPTKRIV